MNGTTEVQPVEGITGNHEMPQLKTESNDLQILVSDQTEPIKPYLHHATERQDEYAYENRDCDNEDENVDETSSDGRLNSPKRRDGKESDLKEVRNMETMPRNNEDEPFIKDSSGTIECSQGHSDDEAENGTIQPALGAGNVPMEVICPSTSNDEIQSASTSVSCSTYTGNQYVCSDGPDEGYWNQAESISEITEGDKSPADTACPPEPSLNGINLNDLELDKEIGHEKDKVEESSQQTTVASSHWIVGTLQKHRGLFYVLLSSLCYTLLGLFIQLTTSIHQLEAGVVRAVFLIIFSLFGITCNKKTLKVGLPKSDIVWIAVVSLLNGFAQLTTFTAYSETSIGDATAIMYSLPALSGVMAWVFLKEPLTVYDFITTIACLCGVFIVSRPTFIFGSAHIGENEMGNGHFIGAVWATITLVILSASTVVTRKLRYASSYVYVLTFGQGIVSTIASVILNSVFGDWSLPSDVIQILYLIGICVVGFFAIYFYSLSLQTEKALIVTVLFTSSIFMSYIFQFALFHDFPDIVTGVGIAVLLLSLCAVFLQKWRMSRADDRSGGAIETIET